MFTFHTTGSLTLSHTHIPNKRHRFHMNIRHFHIRWLINKMGCLRIGTTSISEAWEDESQRQ